MSQDNRNTNRNPDRRVNRAPARRRKKRGSGLLISFLLFLILAAAAVLVFAWFGIIRPGMEQQSAPVPEATELPAPVEIMPESTAEPEPEVTEEPVTELVFASSTAPLSQGEYLVSGVYNGISFRDPLSAFDGNGNSVSVSEDGQSVNGVSIGSFVSSLVKLADGRIGAVSWADTAQQLSVLNASASAVEETIPLPASAFVFVDGVGDYSFYYSDGVEFFGYDIASHSAECLFNWTAVDVSGAQVAGIASDDGRSFSCLVNAWRADLMGYESSLVTISGVSKSLVQEKREMILVSANPVDVLQDAIVSFNRSREDVRIILKSLELDEKNSDPIKAIQQLAQEKLDGKMPDLDDLTGLPYESMAAAGLLADLTPYLAQDGELTAASVAPQVLSALTVNGKVYGTASGFTVGTVIGPGRFLGKMDSWTFDQFNNMTATMGAGTYAFGARDTQSSILYDLLGMNLSRFVNWESRTCSFEGPDFAKILSFAKKLPEETRDTEDSEQVQKGIQLLERASLFTPADIETIGSDYAEPVYIGLPVLDGGGNVLILHKDFAVSSQCADPDAAWQFVRTSLTAAYQAGGWIFPSNAQALEEQLSSAGDKAELVRSILNRSVAVSEDAAIYSLVLENSKGFFEGRDSVSSAASAIQKAVSDYLAALQ